MVIPKSMDRTRAAALFHALSDETRLKLLELLVQGEQCVCDLTDALKTGQSRLSFHLKTLKEAGLLTDRREGRWVYYALAPHALEELGDQVRRLRGPTGQASRPATHCE